MYYIGYILGVILIIWLLGKLFKAVFGKKDTVPPAGSDPGTLRSEERTTLPESEDEDDVPSSETVPAGDALTSDPIGGVPEAGGTRKDERTREGGEAYIKAPSDFDLPETKGREVSFREEAPEREGTHAPEKGKGPTVRKSTEESDEVEEKKTVILYREDAGRYRKRCPYCNTYLTPGSTVCEVCGSRVSA